MIRRIRRLFFLAAAGAFYYSGVSSLWLLVRSRILRRQEVLVVGLHRVLSDLERERSNSLDAIVLKEETFAEIIRYLDRHFEVITLTKFIDVLRGARPGRKPRCLITFDDGWKDNLATALPILQQYRMPAIVFVVTNFVEHHQTFWVERLHRAWQDPELRDQLRWKLSKADKLLQADLDIDTLIEWLKHMPTARREQLLTHSLDVTGATSTWEGNEMISWEEAVTLQRAGVEIESHTANHPLLVYESNETVVNELTSSKHAIEQKLGKKVRAFAYPNGTWDMRVRDIVEKSGYECAFAIQRGWHSRNADPFAIQRTTLYEGKVAGLNGKFSPAVLALRLSGLF